jgi:hypothetical protein
MCSFQQSKSWDCQEKSRQNSRFKSFFLFDKSRIVFIDNNIELTESAIHFKALAEFFRLSQN